MSHALVRAAIAQLLQTTEDLTMTNGSGDADVVITDLDNGFVVATDTGDEKRPTPIVGLTSSTDAERITDLLRGGVSAVVSTESTPDELLRAIRAVAAGDMYFDPRTADVLVARLRNRKRPGLSEQRVRFGELSERERTVLRLVAEGHTGPEIGRILGITAKTVDTYRHRIHEKIGLTHRRDYIHFALNIGLLED